jgi:hypothetical protein
VKLVGADEFHAAFLNESRTRGGRLVPRTGNPGISRFLRDGGGGRWPPLYNLEGYSIEESRLKFIIVKKPHKKSGDMGPLPAIAS